MWKTVGVIFYLMILSIYDVRFRKVPVRWLAMGAGAAVMYMIYLYLDQQTAEVWWNSMKGCVPGVVMLILGWVSGKIGSGDGFVLLIIGSILGAERVMAVFMTGLLMIAGMAGVLLALRKAGKNDKLPFIPFLAAAVILLELI